MENQTIPFEQFSLQNIGAYMLFKEINEDTSNDLCEFIIKANYVFPEDQPITVLINSPGGSVYDGFGIVDLMECSKLKVATVAVGIVASMGAVIFTAGHKGERTMTRNSYIMTHQFYKWGGGRYHELVASRQHEDEIHKRIISHFIKYSKMNEKQVNDILLNPADRYIEAKEALKYGLCDRIQDPWI